MLVNRYYEIMRLTPENKRKVTERVRAAAAKTFRTHGYHAVNLDRLMQEAKLTRGAFYAHYSSKAELFADVMRHEHPLLQLLERRDGSTEAALRAQMLEIFQGYLTPDHLDEVFEGCSLAALTGDTTRADPEVRMAYGKAFEAICAQMARGIDCKPEACFSPLLLASSAVRTARATADPNLRASILTAAWQSFQQLLPPQKGDQTHD